MTMEAVQPRVVDQPVFFPPDDKTYFGIVSNPAPENRKTTGVMMLSGTHAGSTTMGRNRMWVRVGRELAERGYTAMRIDYAGLGESLSGGPIYDLDYPAVATTQNGRSPAARRSKSARLESAMPMPTSWQCTELRTTTKWSASLNRTTNCANVRPIRPLIATCLG